MNFTHQIREAFYKYKGVQYKAIELKVYRTEGKFEYRATPMELLVTDGSNTVNSFYSSISLDQKELTSYFTVDAFTAFVTIASARFGYESGQEIVVDNLDVQTIPQLPIVFASIPHSIADNVWLSSL